MSYDVLSKRLGPAHRVTYLLSIFVSQILFILQSKALGKSPEWQRAELF